MRFVISRPIIVAVAFIMKTRRWNTKACEYRVMLFCWFCLRECSFAKLRERWIEIPRKNILIWKVAQNKSRWNISQTSYFLCLSPIFSYENKRATQIENWSAERCPVVAVLIYLAQCCFLFLGDRLSENFMFYWKTILYCIVDPNLPLVEAGVR